MRRMVEIGKAVRQGFQHHDFPEGTRIAVGNAAEYKLGGAYIAVQTGARVLPVAHNAGLLWPRNATQRPGKVTVVIEPIDSASHSRADARSNWMKARSRSWCAKAREQCLELPLARPSPRGRTLLYQLDGEIVGYRFRRARRRSIAW